jgi:hypothetical protein
VQSYLGWKLGALVLALSSGGCLRQDLSKPVREVYDVRCPAAKIRVLEHQQQNGEERWVLDVCGVPLELERGLEMPTQWRELVADPSEVADLRARLKHPLLGIDEAARDKAEEWCKLGAPGDPSEIAFYSKTDAELAECRRRMRAMQALGVEDQLPADAPEEAKYQDPTKEPAGPPTHWFVLGQWLLMAPITFHRPSCSRLRVMNPPECYCPVGTAASSACAIAERERLARADKLKLQQRVVIADEKASARARNEVEPRSIYYVRGGIGVGYLSSAGGDMSAQGSGSVAAHISVGGMATPMLALGAAVQTNKAFNDYETTQINGDSAEVPLSMLSIQGFASYYFLVQPVFFHFDALAGIARINRAYDPPTRMLGESLEAHGTGPALGLGAGIESYGPSLMFGLRIGATQSWANDRGERFSSLATSLMLDIGYY